MTRTIAALLLCAGLVACASDTAEDRLSTTEASVRCGIGGQFESVTIRALDGTRVVGTVTGEGPTGVLLAHQYPADLCQWAEYAPSLARLGFTVMALDFRCLGLSECPDASSRNRIDLDVVAGVGALQERGIEDVVIVGASAGGTAALLAATRIRPPVSGVVSLSGEPDLGAVRGPLDLNAGAVVGELESPVLLMVSRGDPYVTVASTRLMYEHVASTDKELVVFPGSFGHGIDMLKGSWSIRAGKLVTAFLRERSAQG